MLTNFRNVARQCAKKNIIGSSNVNYFSVVLQRKNATKNMVMLKFP